MWSEATSVLRERAYRREIAEHAAREAIARLDALPVEADQRRQIRRRAVDVAIDLGWARTYDAEYVALAELLEAPLLTVDERLRRGASRRVRCLAPADL